MNYIMTETDWCLQSSHIYILAEASGIIVQESARNMRVLETSVCLQTKRHYKKY